MISKELLKEKTIVIVGPTASGKSKLGMNLALTLGGEIVGCDSVQLYKDFDIGSAKASKEEQSQIKHHMIDIVSWRDHFDASMYAKNALQCVNEILARSSVPIIVGGSGLYLRALLGERFNQDWPKDEDLRRDLSVLSSDQLYEKLKDLDPKRAKELHINDRFRVIRSIEVITLTGFKYSELVLTQNKETQLLKNLYLIYLNSDKETISRKIEKRACEMINSGLIEETKTILDQGCPRTAKPMQSIGYKEVCDYLDRNLEEESLIESIIISTRQYAKRQRTWFNKYSFDLIINEPDKFKL